MRALPHLDVGPHEVAMRARSVVTLLSDFGGRDPFVGIMKGVILGIHPDTALVDLCHEVPAHDILGGSFLLHTAAKVFPKGTIHLAVVDPGVGGPRRPILGELDGQLFVTPDNGLLTYALASAAHPQIRHLTTREYWRHPVSATFHGRDIFASVAGHLAAGVEPARFGELVNDPVRLQIPQPEVVDDGSLRGAVLWVDRFGNCITNVSPSDLALLGPGADRRIRVRVGERVLGTLVAYYGEVAPGASGAIVGSTGHVELFCYQQSLAQRWGVGPGAAVFFSRAAADDHGDAWQTTGTGEEEPRRRPEDGRRCELGWFDTPGGMCYNKFVHRSMP